MSMETKYKAKPIRNLIFKTSEEVYDKENDKYINPTKIYGKVDRNYMNVILSKRAKGGVVEDFHNLPKAYKNKIVEFFRKKQNSGRQVLYLVSKDYKGKNSRCEANK